jgi:hypothetical protein
MLDQRRSLRVLAVSRSPSWSDSRPGLPELSNGYAYVSQMGVPSATAPSRICRAALNADAVRYTLRLSIR